MTLILAGVLLFTSLQARASIKTQYCSSILRVAPANSEWHWTKAQLIDQKAFIFTGKLLKIEDTDLPTSFKIDSRFDGGFGADAPAESRGSKHVAFTFQVVDVMKGDAKRESDLIRIVAVNQMDRSEFKGIACDGRVSFVLNRTYLIFENSFNPFGYQEISGPSDPWYSEIKKLIRKVSREKSKKN